jgi:hypothetical protein
VKKNSWFGKSEGHVAAVGNAMERSKTTFTHRLGWSWPVGGLDC